MQTVEDDVYLCGPPGPQARDLAARLAAALTARGFRVQPGASAEAPVSDPDDRLRRIGETPDFVLLHTPESFEAPAAGARTFLDEAEHALATGRHVVVVTPRGLALPRSSVLPAGLAGLARCPVVEWDPDRESESISRLAHGLSSDLAVSERRLMRRFTRLFAGATLAVLLGVVAQALPGWIAAWTRPGPKPPLPPFAVYWAGYGQRLDEGRWTDFPVEDGGRIAMGDEIRLVFSPSADGHAYVVSRDERGVVSMRFPSDALRGASRVRAGELYAAPVNTEWLAVDGSGLEAIYLVAGYDPLQNLEELIEEPETATNQKSRRDLLDSTIAGLLDGRHAVWGREVWTGSGQVIDSRLPIPLGPVSASATLASRQVVTRRLMVQKGLVSTAVELRLRTESP